MITCDFNCIGRTYSTLLLVTKFGDHIYCKELGLAPVDTFKVCLDTLWAWYYKYSEDQITQQIIKRLSVEAIINVSINS